MITEQEQRYFRTRIEALARHLNNPDTADWKYNACRYKLDGMRVGAEAFDHTMEEKWSMGAKKMYDYLDAVKIDGITVWEKRQ